MQRWISPGLLVALLFCGACTHTARGDEQPSVERSFFFSSGGAYHMEGFGAWNIKLDGDGAFSILHQLRDEQKELGTHRLTADEAEKLWSLVDAAAVDKLEASTRAGVPDEARYEFALGEHRVELWTGDARERPELVALVGAIGELIEAYTGEKPVLN